MAKGREKTASKMIYATQIARLDGPMLCADEGNDQSLDEIKSQIKQVLRRLNRNSESQATVEAGQYTFHYLSDLSTEFSTTYPSHTLLAPTLRPYAFMEFDTFINRTKGTYSDTRATQNLDKLNDELRDVTKVMTKNIEDLLYRGDSLERMGEVSSRLREDSKKYRKAAVRINWELLLKQYGPIGGLGLFVVIFMWWRFFS